MGGGTPEGGLLEHLKQQIGIIGVFFLHYLNNLNMELRTLIFHAFLKVLSSTENFLPDFLLHAIILLVKRPNVFFYFEHK